MRRLVPAFLFFVAISALAQQDYELVLIPVGAYNLPGAFGSVWQTELTGFNEGEAFVPVKADLTEVCALPEGCPDLPAKPHQVFPLFVVNTEGRFIFVGRNHADELRFNLRVYESARICSTARCCRLRVSAIFRSRRCTSSTPSSIRAREL